MEIRPAKTSDIPAITAIYAHAVTHGTASFELEPPDQAEMARRMADFLAKGYPYIVAEADGVLGGYAYSGPYRARPAYRHTVENSVYVAQHMHRRGVGRALLAALIEATAAAGFRQMIAVIGDSENVGSIGMHASLGFQRAGLLRSVGFKAGRWLDSVIMQRPLGQGDHSLPADAG